MNFKTSVVFILLLAYLQIIDVQGLECRFRGIGPVYVCYLTIQNPNGLNNFTRVGGTHMQGRTNEDVVSIQRTDSTITTNVPSILCNTFPNVIRIDLWLGVIEKIDEDSFSNCKRLNTLDLRYNRITEINEKAFIENSMLYFLILSSNSLTTLSENLFINQQELILLELHSNYIFDLPNGIFDPLQYLIQLGLGSNKFTHIKAEWFRNLTYLEGISLPGNNLEDLPPNIFSPMQSLNSINLDDNQLKVVNSNWFGTLKNLSRVFLHRNQINAIDERFIDNTGVYFLGMQNNLCVNQFVIDESPSRQQMRNTLQLCFDNFQDGELMGS